MVGRMLAPTRRASHALFTTVLLTGLYKIFRWWLKRQRSNRKHNQCLSAGSNGEQVGTVADKGLSPKVPEFMVGAICSGVRACAGTPSALRPAPRPAYDDDTRFEARGDDPRYFEGAPLGRTQKAALGLLPKAPPEDVTLAGPNTVSFDPSSTLVRPSIRIMQGGGGDTFGGALLPDDLVVSPELFCSVDDNEAYLHLSQEIGSLAVADHTTLDDESCLLHMLKRACKYFALPLDLQFAHVIWHRSEGINPVALGLGNKNVLNRSDTYSVVLCFGAQFELAFEISEEQEPVRLSCENGGIIGIAPDVACRWRQQERPALAAGTSDTCSNNGQIIIHVVGLERLVCSPSNAPHVCASLPIFQVNPPDLGNLGVAILEQQRPSMRLIILRPSACFARMIRHDDVVMLPSFFCAEDDWNTYYDLIGEMRESQSDGDARSEWVSWHEGSHLLTKKPENSPTFRRILEEIRSYFRFLRGNDDGSRFNWYRDGSDWKPFHHDSAAFNVQRAKTQNCTVGVSFGASRELAFRNAKTGKLLYFPQTNGMLFFFGKDVNIRWQHGINALPKEEQDGKGRVSIILWGLTTLAMDEEGSPPMLEDRAQPTVGRGYRPVARGRGHTGKRDLCRQFRRGACSFGDRCKYSHEIPRYGGS
mmetsp:Transcript_122956/g.244635  ORF Transcript_122956/g.244635 Transcript_122956/m.244635 type:complete len:646 (+) Transcript_122956:87-2024(+)